MTYSRDLVSDLWGRTTVWDGVISSHLISYNGGRRTLHDMANWVLVLNVE